MRVFRIKQLRVKVIAQKARHVQTQELKLEVVRNKQRCTNAKQADAVADHHKCNRLVHGGIVQQLAG